MSPEFYGIEKYPANLIKYEIGKDLNMLQGKAGITFH